MENNPIGGEIMNFNIQAINWDNEKRIKRAKIIADQIARAVKLEQYYSALEFGSGTGLVSFNLYDKLKDITCIDTSQGMIDTLNSKIQQHQVKNMIAYQLDINDDCLLIPTYDLIYTSMVLHHIVDIERTLTNLYRLLKKDGYICIVELDEDDGSFHESEKDFNGHNGFKQNELKKVLGRIGFQKMESYSFYSDTKMIGEVSVNYSLFIMSGKK